MNVLMLSANCGRPILTCLLLFFVAGVAAGEELTLDNATAPAPNRAEEAKAKEFSLDAAVRFLDQASLDWTKSRKCFTCHTNFAYLMSRPSISSDVTAHRQVRNALEEMVEVRWEEQGPRWDAEVVMGAAVLALNDAATTGKLHATTRKALDRMWSVQREDGGVDWLKCGWPPMESDDEFGATMMALAVAAAPEDYQESAPALQGLARLQQYFLENAPPTLHHRAMMLWADSYGADVMTAPQRKATQQELLKLQRQDGGWSLPTLGNWKRGDGKPQDLDRSDGYGTGFVIYVLRRSGLSSDHPQLQEGIAWLKANQRSSGRWYTRSLNKDNKHFISHAGSAFAVLAIASCDSKDSNAQE